ncbi:MAG TPA: zinc metalloprotease [Pyrinomonadaceae bacterium]|jgi:hypothetical protein
MSDESAEQENARLLEERENLRKERDIYFEESSNLRSRIEEIITTNIKLHSAELSEKYKQELYSLIQRVWTIAFIVLGAATLGGWITVSGIVNGRVKDAVDKESEKFNEFKDNMLEGVVEFRRKSKDALNDIEKEKNDFIEQKNKAVVSIRRDSQNTTAPTITSDENQQSGVITIPVVVHVVYKNDSENISEEQINSQIEVLNRDFSAQNKDLEEVPDVFKNSIGNAQIQFALVKTDPNGKSTDGITRTKTNKASFGSNDDVKSKNRGGEDAWDAERYLNIWVCTLGNGILEYAQFPGGPKETDGIVINNKAFGTSGIVQPPFNLGRMTTHSIGHYLNLRHIWGDTEDCSGSDLVSDTPNAAGPNFGKPEFPHVSCDNGPNGDMFMNYMDYVDDAVMHMFTKGQVDRMRETLQTARAKLRYN